jgi:hypothetical protein
VCQYDGRVFTVDITPSRTSDLSLTYDDSAPYIFKWVDTDASLPVRLYEVTYTVKVTCLVTTGAGTTTEVVEFTLLARPPTC